MKHCNMKLTTSQRAQLDIYHDAIKRDILDYRDSKAHADRTEKTGSFSFLDHDVDFNKDWLQKTLHVYNEWKRNLNHKQ